MTLTRKIYILISFFAAITLISYIGSTGSYPYKSLEDCILIRSANNSSAIEIAKTYCKSEIEFEYERMKKNYKAKFLFEKAEEHGSIFEIYEYLAHRSLPFLSVGSIKYGVKKIFSKDTDEVLVNVIRGALLGGLSWGLVGYFINYLRRKDNHN